jgi:hypothetical protein
MESGSGLYKRRCKKGENILLFSQDTHVGVKVKAIPVQAWIEPEGSYFVHFTNLHAKIRLRIFMKFDLGFT